MSASSPVLVLTSVGYFSDIKEDEKLYFYIHFCIIQHYDVYHAMFDFS